MFNFLLEGETGGSWISIAMIVLVIVGFSFRLIRPEKKRERQAQEMRAALQVGDEVTTIGGIIGKVVSIKDETFVLETTKDRTHIRLLVSAIRNVDVKAEESGAVRPRATTPVGTKPADKKADKPEAAIEVEAEEPIEEAAPTVEPEATEAAPAEEAEAVEATEAEAAETTEPAEEN